MSLEDNFTRGIFHFKTITQMPLGHGPALGGMCAWSDDNVVAICSQHVIMMYHVRRLPDGQMIACVDSPEQSIQFTGRNDQLSNSSTDGLALVGYISKKYDTILLLCVGFCWFVLVLEYTVKEQLLSIRTTVCLSIALMQAYTQRIHLHLPVAHHQVVSSELAHETLVHELLICTASTPAV